MKIFYALAAFSAALVCLCVLARGDQHGPSAAAQLKQLVMHSTNAEIGSDAPCYQPPQADGGSATNYCQATVNSQGTAASIGHGGSLDLAQGTFSMTVVGQIQHPASFGMFCMAEQSYNVPFGNGYLCISPFAPGIIRMPVQALSQPMLVLAMEDATVQFQHVIPGSTRYFQFWYRDPTAGGSNFNLSDGLRVTFAPAP